MSFDPSAAMTPDEGFALQRQGLRRLSTGNPAIVRAAATAGRIEPRVRPPGFATLLGIIVAQRISRAAADSIHRRLADLVGPNPVPEAFLGLAERCLHQAGLGPQKIATTRGLARAIVKGELDLAGLVSLGDTEAIAALTRVPGIGRWTAEIYLLGALGRPDVWPGGDYTLAMAVRHLLALDEMPSGGPMRKLAEPWRPFRSAAALILWRYYRTVRAPLAGDDDGSVAEP